MTGAQVRILRDVLGMTQDQFGALLGVHRITVHKWEHDVLIPSPWMNAVMSSFKRSRKVGERVKNALVLEGVGAALYYVLKPGKLS